MDRIPLHIGRGSDAEFEVQWSTGDVTWVPYHDVKHLQKLDEYFEALGIHGVRQLDSKPDLAPPDDRTNHSRTISGVQVGRMTFIRADNTHTNTDTNLREHKNRSDQIDIGQETFIRTCTEQSNYSLHRHRSIDMSAVPNNYNAEHRAIWERYASALREYGAGRGPHPGFPPTGYREVFRITQPFAPVPEDYPPPPQAHQSTPNPATGVAMSDGAFTSLLAHNTTISAQMIAL